MLKRTLVFQPMYLSLRNQQLALLIGRPRYTNHSD